VWRLKSSPRVSASLPKTERHAVLVLYSRWARVSADGRCCTRQSPCHFPYDARAVMGCKQNQPCCGELGRLKCAHLLLSSSAPALAQHGKGLKQVLKHTH
jgi:hypothetical protein